MEEVEEYNFREVVLPSLIPKVPEPELERETGERRRGRDILIAIDHGPNSKHAFDWALIHLCRLADTLHLIHVVSGQLFPHFLILHLFLFYWNLILSMNKKFFLFLCCEESDLDSIVFSLSCMFRYWNLILSMKKLFLFLRCEEPGCLRHDPGPHGQISG